MKRFQTLEDVMIAAHCSSIDEMCDIIISFGILIRRPATARCLAEDFRKHTSQHPLSGSRILEALYEEKLDKFSKEFTKSWGEYPFFIDPSCS